MSILGLPSRPSECGRLWHIALLKAFTLQQLPQHSLSISYYAANNVAANMHVSFSRSCTFPCASVNRFGRMRCTRIARCLLRPGQGRACWNVLSAAQCNAAFAAGSAAATVRNLATSPDKPKGKRWENVDKWVMFSDLHVSVKTLNVCISVLRKIKTEAVARKAGIVFLGNATKAERLGDLHLSASLLSIASVHTLLDRNLSQTHYV